MDQDEIDQVRPIFQRLLLRSSEAMIPLLHHFLHYVQLGKPRAFLSTLYASLLNLYAGSLRALAQSSLNTLIREEHDPSVLYDIMQEGLTLLNKKGITDVRLAGWDAMYEATLRWLELQSWSTTTPKDVTELKDAVANIACKETNEQVLLYAAPVTALLCQASPKQLEIPLPIRRMWANVQMEKQRRALLAGFLLCPRVLDHNEAASTQTKQTSAEVIKKAQGAPPANPIVFDAMWAVGAQSLLTKQPHITGATFLNALLNDKVYTKIAKPEYIAYYRVLAHIDPAVVSTSIDFARAIGWLFTQDPFYVPLKELSPRLKFTTLRGLSIQPLHAMSQKSASQRERILHLIDTFCQCDDTTEDIPSKKERIQYAAILLSSLLDGTHILWLFFI